MASSVATPASNKGEVPSSLMFELYKKSPQQEAVPQNTQEVIVANAEVAPAPASPQISSPKIVPATPSPPKSAVVKAANPKISPSQIAPASPLPPKSAVPKSASPKIVPTTSKPVR